MKAFKILLAVALLALPLGADAQVNPGGGGVVSGTVTANQGTAAAVGSAWPVTLAVGGALNSLTNPIFAQAQGAATTAAPTYTTGTTNPLSLDTSGNLRVTGGVAQASSTASQTGALIMGAATTAVPSYSNASTNPLSQDLTGNLRVTPQASATGAANNTRVAAGQATTVIKASAGTLYAACFDGPATATNTTNFYDNASGSGTVIATPLATAMVTYNCQNYGPVGLKFSLGLTVITANANGTGMTFIWQ